MVVNMFGGARRIAKLIAALAAINIVVGCAEDRVPDDKVFTLYQNAPSSHDARVGLATFDMKWGESNNHYMCQKFAGFLDREFGSDPQVQRLKKEGDQAALGQKHWCEKGRYRK